MNTGRIKEWWRLWDNSIIIGVVATVGITAVVAVGWHIFQTTPGALSEGVVRNHGYIAQYEEEHDGGSTCVSYDEDGSCTWRVQNPDIHHTHCVGGCYSIQVDGCSDNRRGDTICRLEWIDVSEYTYNICRVSQLWQNGRERCLSQ